MSNTVVKTIVVLTLGVGAAAMLCPLAGFTIGLLKVMYPVLPLAAAVTGAAVALSGTQ